MINHDTLRQEIDDLIAALGDDVTIARPAIEREVTAKIRALLEDTRAERTGSSRELWETYLPYAAKRCDQLSRLEEGWEDDLEYFASENAQFWVDNAGGYLEQGNVAGAKAALGRILEAARLVRRDRIAQVDVLLQALDLAYEINDRKACLQLFEEAEKVYRKYLAGGSAYTGTAWLPKIKKMGQKLAHWGDQLRKTYRYAESVTVSIEADSERDLQTVIDYLQSNLVGQVKVTRKAKEIEGEGQGGRARARIKITMASSTDKG